MERNADIMRQFVEKRIIDVEYIPVDDWTDPDGFVIRFDDGSSVEITASEGQGVGYVIVDPIKPGE